MLFVRKSHVSVRHSMIAVRLLPPGPMTIAPAFVYELLMSMEPFDACRRLFLPRLWARASLPQARHFKAERAGDATAVTRGGACA